MRRLGLSILLGLQVLFAQAAPLNIIQTPLFLTASVAPLTMLVMGRDHKLYFEAYNDATDVDGDGQIELSFKPSIDYFGYFDSYKCYSYDNGQKYFYPVSTTATKKCSGNWSGNFLNYVTTARLDAIRKVLYGGYRDTDNASFTILQRTYIPQDGHSWGKEYNNLSTYNISEYTPFSAPTSGNHLFANTTLRNGTADPLLRVALNQPYHIWEWVSIERPVAGSRALNGGSGPLIVGITDYVVRVKVCDAAVGLESNCRTYPNGSSKPIGLLQEYGENDSMMFGLLTGSYVNNLQGGVIRKNISSIKDEINLNTGMFSAVNGIISTLNKLTVVGFDTSYAYDCGWITTRNINNGECSMWGNPIAEMMYESVRYFAGKLTPTASFDYAGGIDATLGLPKPTWQNPYAAYPYCAKANMLVISDIYPSYDSDNVPGSYFSGFTGDLGAGFNAQTLSQTIYSNEGFGNIKAFIGQSQTISDGSPTAKTVTSFGNIRGLAPSETNSQGSYYAAAVAYYAWLNDINPIKDTQNIKTFSVVLSSPLPEFKFNVGGQTITVVPFGKSVNGYSINPTQGAYQPNNNIVDFYIDSISPTGAHFRVNFEDVQQGADFDMDAIVEYDIQVNANNTLTITLTSTYAAGSIVQHMGYVISGTTHDGLYLEVKDLDTTPAADVHYFLDTPPGVLPFDPANPVMPTAYLPYTTSRIFTPSGTPAAVFLKSPLWYAAKWGGFTDSNNNNIPDIQSEWDTSGSGNPDNYFLVTNANNLRAQLAKAFQSILDRSGSFSSASLSSGFLSTDSRIYQAIFKTKDWSGQLLSFAINASTGAIMTNGSGPNGSLWDASLVLAQQNYNTNRRIVTYKPSNKKGIPFRWPSSPASPTNNELDVIQSGYLNTNPTTGLNDNLGNDRLNYIRGNQSKESNQSGTFRIRTSLLGDIIGSAPISVSAPNLPYPIAWPGNAPENSVSYTAFKQSHQNRTQVVYVGANDGMLHAFDGNSGSELFAYVPAAIFKNLSFLTESNYNHHYFVDGSPTVIDAFVNNAWRTMLVGTLNAGGQGVYALDITDPSQFLETNAANMVKWEFTDADDADLGLTYGKASIVRLNNGQWAAIFGNGYNNTLSDGHASTTGNAVIYIVNLETGALIKKFDTKVGMAQDPLNNGRPNGMSAPVVIDNNGDSVADTIYAGDLFGNVWKIDISAPDANQWDFSYKQGANPLPFFIAKDAYGNRQPITAAPTASRTDYSASGLQIYIGTGKFIEPSDKSDTSIQSVYALRDSNIGPIPDRSVLLQQFILYENAQSRVVSTNLIANNQRGWYMDLVVNNQVKGERIIADLVFLSGKLIFSTIIPTSDPCDFGGESWLMEVNAITGGRLNYSVFDNNGDGAFNGGDNVTYNDGSQNVSAASSGMKSTVGLVSTPAILNAGTKEFKYMAGTSGGIQSLQENPGKQIYGRQSWRQLQ